MKGILCGIAVMAFGVMTIRLGRNGMPDLPFWHFSDEKSRKALCTVFGTLCILVGFCAMFLYDKQ